MLELSYGPSKVLLGTISGYNLGIVPINTGQIPMGQTIYYRLMSSGANGTTIKIGLRYFYDR